VIELPSCDLRALSRLRYFISVRNGFGKCFQVQTEELVETKISTPERLEALVYSQTTLFISHYSICWVEIKAQSRLSSKLIQRSILKYIPIGQKKYRRRQWLLIFLRIAFFLQPRKITMLILKLSELVL
jgi:hypothetical protein